MPSGKKVLFHVKGIINGRHGPLCPLAMPVTVVQPGFIKGGAKARERSDLAGEGVGGGFPPPHGREIFFYFMYENFIFLDIICYY